MRPAAALVERLGLAVRDLELLQQALIHSSYLHEHRDLAAGHNERLEFLGDSVVSLAISDALYRRHPDDDEGVLSARRASIVSTTGLARLAARLELGEYLLLGEGESQRGGRRRPALLASAFEALVGAVYLDLGYEVASGFVTALAAPELTIDRPLGALKSPKSRLQEYTQRLTGRAPSIPPRRGRRSGPRQGVPVEVASAVRSSVSDMATHVAWPKPKLRAHAIEALRLRKDSSDAEVLRRNSSNSWGRTATHAAIGWTLRWRARPPASRGRRWTCRRTARGVMTAPARLLALRLQGFKSFGERTLVEFGPGISAVVGPNGSGKSNLADALRWALGEQGRALRLRKSEDVIFAGSEKRSALGMADVTLVFGNTDRLLPIDYETVELGRRLFRSGENDYLLNKQRVRLKDLVDLLDAAHLADNAFLFIGQGMVDQALALRPEERRPLFEEVAGVRRHERRKPRPRTSWRKPRRIWRASRTSSRNCGPRPVDWQRRRNSRFLARPPGGNTVRRSFPWLGGAGMRPPLGPRRPESNWPRAVPR
jgi:ribonuclease III